MADEARVKPTPIQRNTLDVATELTMLYYSSYSMGDVAEIQSTFAKFYAIAGKVQGMDHNMAIQLIPEELKKLFSTSR